MKPFWIDKKKMENPKLLELGLFQQLQKLISSCNKKEKAKY